MLPLGHLGIGLELATPFSKKLSKKVILLGAILPDLIDKPLYYVHSFLMGATGTQLGMIDGTRSFGHTALFLIGLTLFAFLRKSRLFAALSLGVATHLLLDGLSDRITERTDSVATTLRVLLWPFEGLQFPVNPYNGVVAQLGKVHTPFFFICEVVGALLLFWQYWKYRHPKLFINSAVQDPEGRGILAIARRRRKGRR